MLSFLSFWVIYFLLKTYQLEENVTIKWYLRWFYPRDGLFLILAQNQGHWNVLGNLNPNSSVILAQIKNEKEIVYEYCSIYSM